MTRSGPRTQSIRGFTLLEVMLAVVVAAFVLVAINGVFFAALRLRTRATESLNRALHLDRALRLIERDLANLVPPGGALSGALQTPVGSSLLESSLGGSFRELGQVGPEFHTASAVLDEFEPWAEVQKVAYLLLDPTNRTARGKELVRSVTRNLLAPTLELRTHESLLGGVERVAFLFHDGNQWREVWDSTTEETPLPRAVKLELQLLSETDPAAPSPAIELVVPLMMDGMTNSVTNAVAAGGTP